MTYFDPYDLPDDWREARRYLVKCTDTILSADNYIGEGRPRGMVSSFIGRHRDSDILTESNFAVTLEELQGVDERCEVRSCGHWAVGWTEAIYVPATAACITMVQGIHAALADYPILSESDFSERELEDALDQWESWGRSDTFSELPEDWQEWLDDNEGTVIGADIMTEATRGFTDLGLGDDLCHESAAEAVRAAVEDWHAWHRWNVATCHGAQCLLFTAS